MTVVSERPVPGSRVVRDPGHGEAFTEHLYELSWSPERGWHEPRLGPVEDLSLHPATIGLHYGQVAFEGLKAHRKADGSMGVFRPRDHARRFQRSTRRLCMPELPEDTFVEAIERVVAADEGMLSDDPTHSLYLRPFMFGTDVSLMLRPSREYRFMMMAMVAGGFFGDQVQSVSVWVSHEHSRAMQGGTGDVKIAGNYAPTFLAQQAAAAAGCQQVVWLDAAEHRWLEEMGGMNLFMVRGEGEHARIVTPQLTGTLLPGVTRDTLLTVAGRLGYEATQERISLEQWRDECASGEITEVFACGTAAVVTPVAQVRDAGGDWTIGQGKPGPVTLRMRQALVDLHHGVAPDPDGWLHGIG